MKVDELVETMERTRVPSTPDLIHIRRKGARLRVRRRAFVGLGVAGIALATAAPLLMLNQGQPAPAGPAAGVTGTPDDSVETIFETTAPIGTPVSAVIGTDMKFYLGPQHTRSVGALSLWREQRPVATELAYGARLIDGDKTLRRAGYLRAPVLPRTGGKLVRVPGQNQGEPTFVGLVPAPKAAGPLVIDVGAPGTSTVSGQSPAVIDGYVLVWVTATAGDEPGIDLVGFHVEDARGHLVANGTFQGRTSVP
jgi:hypothetical protein